MVGIPDEDILAVAAVNLVAVVSGLGHAGKRSLGGDNVRNIDQRSGGAPQRRPGFEEEGSADIGKLRECPRLHLRRALIGAVGLVETPLEREEDGSADGDELRRFNSEGSVRQVPRRAARDRDCADIRAVGDPEAVVVMGGFVNVENGEDQAVAQRREVADCARFDVGQIFHPHRADGGSVALPELVAVAQVIIRSRIGVVIVRHAVFHLHREVERVAHDGESVGLAGQGRHKRKRRSVALPEHRVVRGFGQQIEDAVKIDRFRDRAGQEMGRRGDNARQSADLLDCSGGGPVGRPDLVAVGGDLDGEVQQAALDLQVISTSAGAGRNQIRPVHLVAEELVARTVGDP